HGQALEVRQVVHLNADITASKRQAVQGQAGIFPLGLVRGPNPPYIPVGAVLTTDDPIGGIAERVDETVLAAFLLPAFERHAFIEVAPHLKTAAVDFVEHLVWILDEIFQALEKLDRKAVGPDDHTRMTVETKHFLQTRQVLDRVVKQLIAILERRAL